MIGLVPLMRNLFSIFFLNARSLLGNLDQLNLLLNLKRLFSVLESQKRGRACKYRRNQFVPTHRKSKDGRLSLHLFTKQC